MAAKRWRVNGVEYRSSLAELAGAGRRTAGSRRLADLPVVTAHGDDHHGNVWALDGGTSTARCCASSTLPLPATDIPALLAPVKATYHNALAHPFWLYHPDEAAARFRVETAVGRELVEIAHDADLSQLRQEVLASAAELIWRPLLREMAERSWLPGNWRQIVRSALFCCPMLVTNLVAERRPAQIRLLGLAQAVAAGSEPVDGRGRHLGFPRRGGAMRLAEVQELVRLRPPQLDPVKRVIARCHSVEDLRQAARRKLPRAVFDYVDGGADAESKLCGQPGRLRTLGLPAPDPARRLRPGPVGRAVRAPADGPARAGPHRVTRG